jgi:ESS family glutamate:Na+ symporter
MKIPFQFEPLLIFGWMSAMLLIGVVLRARIRFFQNYLIPSCLIGGILGLILETVGVIRFPSESWESFAYHLFNISFISVGLTAGNAANEKASTEKGYLKGSFWMCLTMTSCFGLQAALGGLLVILFGLLGSELFPTFGFLVPMGFEEGPGQALSFGKVWEGVGFEHGATIGLTFAAVGFLFSFFVGVPLANWGLRKGLASQEGGSLSSEFIKGIYAKDKQSEAAGRLTTHSANIDTLAFHVALIGLAYGLTYVFTLLLAKIVATFAPDVAAMLWGFFFFFGLCIAFLVKVVVQKSGAGHLLDGGMQRRLTGWSVDFLIVATIMAIQLVVVWKFIVPIVSMALACGIATTLLTVYLGKRLWSYNLERMVAIYGVVTGTVSSGLLLLRIVDPEFKTPIAVEIGIMNLFMVPVVLGSGILVNAPLWWGWSVGMTVLVFTGLLAVALVLLKTLKMVGPSRL